MFKLLRSYREGKRLEKAYSNAQIFIQMILFQKIHDNAKIHAIDSYLFCRDDPNQHLYPDIENETCSILDSDLDLQELVAATIHVGLALCFGHNNRQRAERLMSNVVFSKYCGKYQPPDATRYDELNQRAYQRLMGSHNQKVDWDSRRS